jgi:hypothetical protein
MEVAERDGFLLCDASIVASVIDNRLTSSIHSSKGGFAHRDGDGAPGRS